MPADEPSEISGLPHGARVFESLVSWDRTLSDEEVDAAGAAILAALDADRPTGGEG